MANWTTELIAEIMQERNIDPAAVPNKFRFQVVHGFGFLRCSPKCKNSWASYWIWIRLDLKRTRISYRFKQKCTKCGKILSPIVPSESLEEMTKFVCDRYQNLVDGVATAPPERPNKKTKVPHKSDLCEKCGFGAHPCWLPRQTTEQVVAPEE